MNSSAQRNQIVEQSCTNQRNKVFGFQTSASLTKSRNARALCPKIVNTRHMFDKGVVVAGWLYIKTGPMSMHALIKLSVSILVPAVGSYMQDGFRVHVKAIARVNPGTANLGVEASASIAHRIAALAMFPSCSQA
jgi:hypothetical protein